MDNFYAVELEKALTEQHFGTIASRVDKEVSTGGSAFASIQLLEQREIRVKLSNNGYEMVTDGQVDSEQIKSQAFETLDDLLLAISPNYATRRAEELMIQLSRLADTES